MCGIAGFFSAAPQPANIIGRMNGLIRHRGPDDEGYVLFQELSALPRVCGGPDTPAEAYRAGIHYAPQEKLDDLGDYPVTFALGHRRLSIVDLSPLGHQPMSSADGRYWIVYNGEVYNHIELRAELEKAGYRFVSHSDTEVIIAAYDYWGEACLNLFNGMWAFVLLDRKEQKVFMARDRFGVKPLYYWASPSSTLAFASEIKAFTVLPGWQALVNGQRLYDFLAWGIQDHTDETMFAGVYQIPPGGMARWQVGNYPVLADGRLPVERWYQLTQRPFEGSRAQAAEGFLERFNDAVSLRLRADVPVGSCLSGGLDSSAIVCVMNRFLRERGSSGKQKTFSACARVQRFDERQWIDQVVAATEVEAHYVYPELEGLFQTSPQITWHQDEPFGSTSIYAQWRVFELASRNNVRVMLDGQGADEQLAGYHGFFGPHLNSLFHGMHWLAMMRELAAIHHLHGYDYARCGKFLASVILPEGVKHVLRRTGVHAHARPDWLNWERLGAKPENPFSRLGAVNAGSVHALSVAQLTAANLPMLLHWEDRDSMAHSVEARVPFLDYRLVEYVLGLPDEFKLDGGVTKRVLRDAMSGILPEAIRGRVDKLGFVTPEEVWLREHAPEQFRNKLNESIAVAGGVLKAEESRAILEAMITGRREFSFLPWRMISLGEWVTRFSVEI